MKLKIPDYIQEEMDRSYPILTEGTIDSRIEQSIKRNMFLKGALFSQMHYEKKIVLKQTVKPNGVGPNLNTTINCIIAIIILMVVVVYAIVNRIL